MGSGALARQLYARSVQPTVLEIEPKIVEAARRWFGLPEPVEVVVGDGRAGLRRIKETYDLVFLDAFAGESVPWHIVTREGLGQLKEKLAPGGRLVVNTVTTPSGSPGLARLEAVLLDVFDETDVYVETAGHGPDSLVNATLVAGKNLQWQEVAFPGSINPVYWNKIGAMRAGKRAAQAGAKVASDDWSDLDYADSGLRSRWRDMVVSSMHAGLLAD
jgi:spermidine synthase